MTNFIEITTKMINEVFDETEQFSVIDQELKSQIIREYVQYGMMVIEQEDEENGTNAIEKYFNKMTFRFIWVNWMRWCNEYNEEVNEMNEKYGQGELDKEKLSNNSLTEDQYINLVSHIELLFVTIVNKLSGIVEPETNGE